MRWVLGSVKHSSFLTPSSLIRYCLGRIAEEVSLLSKFKCLHQVTHDLDRFGIVLVQQLPRCLTRSLPELIKLVSDMVLGSLRLVVLGDINSF